MTETIEQASIVGLPDDIARKIGFVATDHGREIGPVPVAEPQTQMDWALYWARKKLSIFPCRSFLGLPQVKNWYSEATTSTSEIIHWWSDWPDADIGCVPDKSGHFVIVAIGDQGADSLDKLGELKPEFETDNRWGDRHLWFKGRAYSSWNLLGPKLHVVGAGRYLYLPNSTAPNADRDPADDAALTN